LPRSIYSGFLREFGVLRVSQNFGRAAPIRISGREREKGRILPFSLQANHNRAFRFLSNILKINFSFSPEKPKFFEIQPFPSISGPFSFHGSWFFFRFLP